MSFGDPERAAEMCDLSSRSAHRSVSSEGCISPTYVRIVPAGAVQRTAAMSEGSVEIEQLMVPVVEGADDMTGITPEAMSEFEDRMENMGVEKGTPAWRFYFEEFGSIQRGERDPSAEPGVFNEEVRKSTRTWVTPSAAGFVETKLRRDVLSRHCREVR